MERSFRTFFKILRAMPIDKNVVNEKMWAIEGKGPCRALTFKEGSG